MTEDRGQITDEGRRTKDERQSGFSLVEVIVTLVVLSIAAAGVLSVFSATSRGSADPLILSQAVGLAQEKRDVIAGDRGDPGRGFAWIIPANYPAENPVIGFPNFNRNTAIFCVNAGALNTDNGQPPPCVSGYAHVTVTVTHAVIGSLSVETVVTNY